MRRRAIRNINSLDYDFNRNLLYPVSEGSVSHFRTSSKNLAYTLADILKPPAIISSRALIALSSLSKPFSTASSIQRASFNFQSHGSATSLPSSSSISTRHLRSFAKQNGIVPLPYEAHYAFFFFYCKYFDPAFLKCFFDQ